MPKKYIIIFQVFVVTLLVWMNSGVHSRANTNEPIVEDVSKKPFYSVYNKEKWTESMGLIHPLVMNERAIAQGQIKRMNSKSGHAVNTNLLEEVKIKLNKLYRERDHLALKLVDYWRQHPEDVRNENKYLLGRLQKEEQVIRERISHPQSYNIDVYTSLIDKTYTLFVREPTDCLRYIQSENVKDKLGIITVLSDLVDPAYAELISTMTNDPNTEIRDAATKALTSVQYKDITSKTSNE